MVARVSLNDTCMAASAKPALRGLITGASSGIGRVLTQQLSEKYTLNVTLIGRKESALQAVADEVAAAGGVAHAVVCDVSSFEQVEQAWKQHTASVGGTDFLVLNAGLNRPGKVHEISESHFDDVMAVVRARIIRAESASRVPWAARIGQPKTITLNAEHQRCVGLASPCSPCDERGWCRPDCRHFKRAGHEVCPRHGRILCLKVCCPGTGGVFAP